MSRTSDEEAEVSVAEITVRLAGGPPGYLQRWAPATNSGGWEAPVIQTICSLLRTNPAATFLDVGAYIGIYSLLASRLLPNGTVIALEPDPVPFEDLAHNIELNGCSNVQAHRIAIGATTCVANFQATADSLSHLSSDGTELVHQMSLDEFCEQHRLRPQVVKVDIEGGETAFAGHLPVVLDEADLVIMEIHDRPPFNLDGAIQSLMARIEPFVFLQRKSDKNFHVAFGRALQDGLDPADWTLKP